MAETVSPAASLPQTPTAAVRAQLDRLGLDADDVVLAAATDLPLMPGAHLEWVVATRERVLVISENGKTTPTLDIPLDRIDSIEAEEGVGAGLLRAATDGQVVDLARYSPRRADVFTRLASRLERLRRGEPVTPEFHEAAQTGLCPGCGLMLPGPAESCPRCVPRGAVLWRVLRLMRSHLRSAVGILVLLLIGVGLDLISPQLTRVLVDRVLPGAAGSPAAAAEAIEMLTIVVGALAIVQSLRALVNVANGRLAARVGTAITYDIRARLVERLQQLSIGFYDRQQVGSLVGRVAYDTEAMHGFIWQLTGGFILQIVMVIGVFLMMFTLDWRLALLALLPAPLVMGGTIYFWRRVYPRYHRSWEASSRQAGALTGMLSGIRVVKLFGQERREADRFNHDSNRLRAARLGVDGANAIFGGIIGLFFQIGGWIVWYAGGRGVIQGSLTLGELMAFFGYLWMFYGPLAALPQLTNWFSQFTTQANRVFDVLDTPETIRPPADPVHIAPVRGDIAFEGVTFAYTGHDPVIRALDLKVEAGERLGIVGPSGSGKSSLIQLLCRFYDPIEGRVTLDGVDVREVEKDELRRSIGIVLQEPFLFRGTIAENICYGDPTASAERLIEAAIAADCHDFILKHPHAYDTWLGERGAGLSGGERQRLGIARTLISDPRVLVLDEATSSIDPDSESFIRDSLEAWTSGRTTIAIAHRLSTLRDMHRVIVLENGRIVEQGPPEDLLAAGGVFARMCRTQGLESFQPRAHNEPRAARWLTPETAQITEGQRGSLVVVAEGRVHQGVYALPCMPVHHPEGLIALRYGRRNARQSEVGLIATLRDWPDEARGLVEQSLGRRYLVRTVRAIESIELIQNFLSFEVETDAGPAAFLTRWAPESIIEHGPDGRLIIASDGAHYLIPGVRALSERERRLFLRHVYW